MARVTVEDCVTKIPNRFDLVMLAAQRARDISAGATLTLDRDNDKNPVVGLREIAEAKVAPDDLTESLVRSLQKHAESDEPDEEQMELHASDFGEESETIIDYETKGAAAGIQVIDAEGDSDALPPDLDSPDGGNDAASPDALDG